MLYMYDPSINLKTETSYDYLVKLTGKKKSILMSLKSKGLKIRSINVYLIDETTTLQQRKQWYEKEIFKEEAWQKIKGFDDKYLISNYGRIKSNYSGEWKFILPLRSKVHGYMYVHLRRNKFQVRCKIANLVAEHFVGNRKKGEVLRHRNGIITDDYAGNLEFCKRPTHNGRNGAKCGKEVLKLDIETLEVVEEYRSLRQAAKENFLSVGSVHSNVQNRTKTSGGYIFKYREDFEK